MKFIAAAATLAGVASAMKCENLTIPITASGRNGVFKIPAPVTNIDVTNFILDNSQQGGNFTEKILHGYKTVSGNFKIAATYCQPDDGPSSSLQILTHGIGFDRSYWNAAFNNFNYSYVAEAVDRYGFSTFSYDRLGIGMSSHGDPVNVIQTLLEVDALRGLTTMLREGKIKGVPHGFDKFLHIGHSFGSVQTYALTAMYPGISDGIGLTGFSQNGSFIADFMYGGNFIQANKIASLAAYPNGYLGAADASAVQTNFFAPGDFDPKILPFAVAGGEPVTVGELLTIGGGSAAVNKFPGPVHIITGERDVPFCGGNCLAAPTGFSSVPATSKKFFPKTSKFEVSIIPGAGHGLNLQFSHPTTYASILNFFVQNGVGPKGGKDGHSGHGKGSGWEPPHGKSPYGGKDE